MSSSSDSMRFNIGFGSQGGRARRKTSDRARVLVIGDFIGAGDFASATATAVHSIDWDNFDEVVERLQPTIVLESPDLEPLPPIPIRSIDDFHPDRLFADSEIFTSLRHLRARLADAATFAQAAAEMNGRRDPPPVSEPSPANDSGSDLERLLGGDVVPTSHAPAQPRSLIDSLLRRAVSDAAVAGPDPEQERLVAAIDAQISDLARSILHDPAFERVESLWRSVYALVNAVSDGEGVSVHITAFAQGALAEDLRSAGDELQAAEVFRRIVADNDRVGAEPWAMVVADYYFGHAGVELDTLARLGAISREAGAILLAGAAPDLVGAVDRHALGDAFIWRGADDPAFEDWQALRAADAANAIGLVLPRVLLRHPYSPQSDPIESFDFSEQLAAPESRYYLWGNGAFVCARLLVQSFLMHEGWRFNPDGHLEVDDLPMWTFETPAGRALQPVAEVAMSERTAREIDTRGVMALCSIQQRNACRLLRFASVSLHDRSLQGPWTRV